MKELVQIAVAEARRGGADYADARAVREVLERITARDAGVLVDRRDSEGVAVRARVRGAWGFAAVARPAADEVRRAAREAAAAASAAALLSHRTTPLAAGPRGPSRHVTAHQRDAFSVPLADKVAIATAAVEAARRTRHVRQARCFLRFSREHAWIATSDGALSERVLHLSGGGVQAIAGRDGRLEVRTLPAHGGGVWAGGFEIIERMRLADLGERAGREAAELLGAPLCPAGTADVVLDPWAAARLLHETVGHALEADVPSAIDPRAVGRLRIGSHALHVLQDGSLDDSPGTLGMDDEALAIPSLVLVRSGVVEKLLGDRERGGELGIAPAGCARAESYRVPPRVRMTTLAIGTGVGDALSLLGGGDGILLEGARGYAVDARRSAFRLAAEVAWEVRKGRRARMLRGVAIGGPTRSIWQSLDGLGGVEARSLCGLWCVKAGERVAVGHRVVPVRLRRVAVGPAGGP